MASELPAGLRYFFACAARVAASIFTAGAVFQLAHRAERPDDHLIADVHARQHLEVLLARDAGLHRREHRLVVADDEHALELFALLAGLQLLRRDGRAAAAALRRLRFVAHDVAFLVHDHFADGRGLDRHATPPVAASPS